MIIKIEAYENGGHDNQSTVPKVIPDGWAVIPDGMETENFPFGDIEVEEINGVMTVVKWTAGTMPEPEPVEEEPSQMDVLEAQVMYTAMMTDTLIEG